MKVIEFKKGVLFLLDQRKLPLSEEYVKLESAAAAAGAIKNMVVRGAPAIGIAAAYGYCLALWEKEFSGKKELVEYMKGAKNILASSRPTAVNLKWALEKMHGKFLSVSAEAPQKIQQVLKKEADGIMRDQREADRKMGQYGAATLKKLKKGKLSLMTHCNAGALATGGRGTALGVIRAAQEAGMVENVFANETRPRLQGARLTCWELQKDGIPCTLSCDGAGPWLIREGKVDAVITGADRIAANGDTANKIGTYSLALAAKESGVPFYIAAPLSTFDFDTSTGEEINIEYRDSGEVTQINGKRIAPEGVRVINPAFDITPRVLIKEYITEKGTVKNVQELQ